MLKIYIVEDNLLMASVLKHLLTRMGYEICGSADNYTKAVRELRKNDADLVITDIMLTGKKTGIDIGNYIKKHLDIPFIYLSSVTESDIIKQAMDSSPGNYLFKPVNKPALAEAIFNIIHGGDVVETGSSSPLHKIAINY